MKFKKKTLLLFAFTLGALLFATTALADIAYQDGYAQLKNSLKLTASKCSSQLDSFTMEMNFNIKHNGQVIVTDSEIKKYDKINQAVENRSHHEYVSRYSNTNYYYGDSTTDIVNHSSDGDTYYVTEYTQSRDNPADFHNPFEEEEANDVERIIDALVGSLRDHVVVEENDDGSKKISGSLTDVQIPALINAIVSLEMKQQFRGQSDQMPDLAQDVYVKEITGSALISPEGLLERIIGTAVISGQDSQGTRHEITAEVMFELKDINQTTVVKPDLSGKTVVKEQREPYSKVLSIPNLQKFIGHYNNDIVIEENGKFVKIGERHLEIIHIDQSSIKGRYYEQYKPEYEQYAENNLSFNFEANFEENNTRNANFTYTSSTGNNREGNIYLDDYSARIDLWFNDPGPTQGKIKYNSSFNPVLD